MKLIICFILCLSTYAFADANGVDEATNVYGTPSLQRNFCAEKTRSPKADCEKWLYQTSEGLSGSLVIKTVCTDRAVMGCMSSGSYSGVVYFK